MQTCSSKDSGPPFENATATAVKQQSIASSITPSRAAIAALHSTLIYIALCAVAILAGLLIANLLNGQRGTERSIALAGNELLYRACAREAMLKHIPVKPYPQESERISLVREGDRVMQRLERLEADVINMRVENGCEVSLQRQVLTEPLQDDALALMPVMPAANAPVTTQEIIVDTAERSPVRRRLTTSRCEVARDMSMQNHFMLLNQCLPNREKTVRQENGKNLRRSHAALRVAT